MPRLLSPTEIVDRLVEHFGDKIAAVRPPVGTQPTGTTETDAASEADSGTGPGTGTATSTERIYAIADREHVVPILSWLRDEPELAFDFLTDVTVVDHAELEIPEIGTRFAVVYQLYSREHNHRFTLKARAPESDPRVPSATGLWDSALWAEREAHDMFGVEFEGSPDMRRLLMPEDYPGFPLRKDYPLRGRGERDAFPRYRSVATPAATRSESTAPPPEKSSEETAAAAREDAVNPTRYVGEGQREWAEAEDPDYHGDHPEPRFFFTDEEEDDFGGRVMTLNLGPQHPAMHGTLRAILQVKGEEIVSADTEIGYLHTGFEKIAEHMSYQQWVTVTDRMNYMSAMNNNIGYAVACEELFGVEPPRRAQVLRVILGEFGRLADHFVCVGLAGMDVGAFSVMLWAFERRELIYDLMEAVTGTRLTTSYTRIGGLFRDVPDDFEQMVAKLLDELPPFIDELCGMLVGNRIFEDRMRGTGAISAEDAVSWGLTGPLLRAAGVPYDVRKSRPYCGYERYEFDVPTQTTGDSFARFEQRIAECWESLKIIRQAMDDLPDGPVNVDDKKTILPDKAEVYQNIEGLIHHFKQVMFGHGLAAPAGAEIYSSTEAPNGELGFYIVSSGETNSYRTRVRPPSLFHYAALSKLIEGSMISDAVAVLSTLNIIAGELDR